MQRITHQREQLDALFVVGIYGLAALHCVPDCSYVGL